MMPFEWVALCSKCNLFLKMKTINGEHVTVTHAWVPTTFLILLIQD